MLCFNINSLLLLFLVSVYSLSYQDFVPIIDEMISDLRKMNFRNELGLATLSKLIMGLSSSNATEKYTYNKVFSKRGGLEVVAEWFNSFQQENQTQTGNLTLTKTYFGRLAVLIYWGVDYSPFCEEMVNEKLLERLLPFMLSPLLFSDSNFTEDTFAFLSETIVSITQLYLQPKLYQRFQEVFGSHLEKIKTRFHSEEDNLFFKLLAGNLLAKRNVSAKNAFELQQFAVDPNILISNRNFVNSFINQTDYFIYHMKTPYFIQRIYMNGYTMLKYFNNLLLSKRNRQRLCDLGSFNFYLWSIQKFSLGNIGFHDFEGLCICSLRALFILSQTCDQYHQYFKESQTFCK